MPKIVPSDLYETDFHSWTEAQSRAIEEGRWQRQEISDRFSEAPTLSRDCARFVARAYEHARARLRYETYFFESDFPSSCPFTPRQILDAGYYPEELDAPVAGAFPVAQTIGR